MKTMQVECKTGIKELARQIAERDSRLPLPMIAITGVGLGIIGVTIGAIAFLA
ncbi:MAG: hypothetical protein OXE81_11120 [Gammaproteobacteria bacterium]|nr:hypothetical protein [Gammaproteobacteria bacterium]